MNYKIYLFAAVAIAQSVIVECKDYPLLSRLNNITSQRCNAIEAARFFPSEEEDSCDALEKILNFFNGSGYTQPTDILFIQHHFKNMKISKEPFRIILSDQDVATKFKEYRDYKALAADLKKEKMIHQEEAQMAYKKRRAEEKLTQF